MTSSRSQNVSVLRHPGIEPWEPSIVAFTETGGNFRSAPRNNSLRTGKNAYKNGKTSGRSPTSSLTEAIKSFHKKNSSSINKFSNSLIKSSVDSSSKLNPIYRELSPVRWCDREVDGVYLGKSGWVQVHQRSLEDCKEIVLDEYSGASTLPCRKNISSCRSDERRERDRPINLPLSTKKRDARDTRKRPSKFFQEFDSMSPPSVTPIISPPPAFKDNGLDAEFSSQSLRRPFSFKESPLPKSRVVSDCEGSLSPPIERRITSKSPSFWKESAPVSSFKHHRPLYQALQSKSLEDDYSVNDSKWHKRRPGSLAPFALFDFRSLDNEIRETDALKVNANSSFRNSFETLEDAKNSIECDKEKNDDDNEETQPKRYILESQSSCETSREQRFSSKASRPRYYHRNARRTSPNDFGNMYKTRSSSSDSSSTTSSSSSSSGTSFNDKNSEKASSRRINSKQSQPYLSESSHGKDSKHFYVKRSRSLQLSEKRSPNELMFLNQSSSGKSWDPMPSEHVTFQAKNSSRNKEQFSQRPQHRLVTVNGESIPVFGSCHQSLRSLNKITTSEAEQKKLILEAEKEARIISDFINVTRSRTAARNLLMHRYFKQPEDEFSTKLLKKTEHEPHFIRMESRSQNKPAFANDVNYGGFHKKSQIYSDPDCGQHPTIVSAKPFAFLFRSFQNHSDVRLTPVEKKVDHRSKRNNQNVNRSLNQCCSNSRTPKDNPVLFSCQTPKVKSFAKQSAEKTRSDHLNFPIEKTPGESEENFLEDNSSISSSSSSSSSVDIRQHDFRTKSRQTEFEASGLTKEFDPETTEILYSRPGSAPENDECVSTGIDQRSLSLPRSFLSEHYRLNYFYQRNSFPGEQQCLDSSSAVTNECPINSEEIRTAPTTPIRELRYIKGTESLKRLHYKKSSCTSLSEEYSSKPHRLTQNVTSEEPERSAVSLNERVTFPKYKSPQRILDSSSETVVQKFKKNFSLKNLKTKGNLKTSNERMNLEADNPSAALSLANNPICPLQGFESKEEHQELGFIKKRSMEKRGFKNEKYDSHDSGIQMGNRGNVDSSESQDTDLQEDVDSPLCVRRHDISFYDNFCRPQSEIFNQVLIDKFKADLQWRTKVEKSCNGRGVRRTNSDLGGQRLYNWDLKNNCRKLVSQSSSVKGSHAKTACKPLSPEDLERLSRPRLRRSLSQPLGLNELPTFVRRRSSMLKGFALSEDEKNPRERNSEDEFLSDSESSVASLSERKKTDFYMRGKAAILAEAVWDHVAIESCELPFRAGDVIEVLDTRDRDWWWGVTNDNCGYFPSAFVRLRVSQEDTVEDCLAAMAKGKSGSTQLRRGISVSLLSNDQVRSSIVKELLNTERNFVKILRDIKDGYVTQCKRRTDMFTLAQISTMFSNLEDLLIFQEKFLMDLEARIDRNCPYKSCIGEVFLNHGSGFRMYSEYCNSHPMAIATLQDLYQRNDYCKFFETCRLKQSLTEIPLDGYLLTPVQRICKYPLQLAELLKYTKPDHPDYKRVEEALETMRRVATLINERKRKMESLEKLAAWQQRVDGWEGEDLIEISSQLIHQGDVVRITSAMWTSNITLFLFDHQIIYCKKDLLKRNVYTYKGRIFLKESVVIDLPDGKNQQLGVTIKHGLKISNSFKDKWLMFCCRSREDKVKWLEALEEEKRLVAQEKEVDLDLPPTAKQLAKMAARTKKCPPCKPRGKSKLEGNHEEILFRRGHPDASKPKSGRRVGTWFTFAGVMKNSKVNLRSRAPLHEIT